MAASGEFSEIIEDFTNFTIKPESFLSVQDNLNEPVKNIIKRLYDLTKNEEVKLPSTNALPELIIESFDTEQIWQELELQNEDRWTYTLSNVSKFLTNKNNLQIPIEFSQDVNHDSSDEPPENIDVVKESKQKKANSKKSTKKESAKTKTKTKSKKQEKGSIVDDEFFKLREMEEFLDAEDKAEMMKEKKMKKKGKRDSSDEDDEDDEIDLFNDWDSDNDSEENDENEVNPKQIKYNDFFGDGSESGSVSGESDLNTERQSNGYHNEDKDDDENGIENEDNSDDMNDSEIDLDDDTTMKRVRFDLPQPSSSDDDDEDNNSDVNEEPANSKNNAKESDKNKEPENLSEFQLRQQRLNKKIGHLENNLLEEKSWTMKGEVDASHRPQNSLLEEVVDFDMLSRPAPVITEETTLKLQDIIIQRIKDKSWDDVERKAKPVQEVQEFKKQLVLDQEKSKLSLAQVYEQDYIKQREALEPDADEKPEEIPKEHVEIKELMSSLFAKLDTLCNFHYTPKLAAPEVKIISNMAAITMEEVAPVAVSDAVLLAPEEIKAKPKGDIIGETERTSTDKKRQRREKKLKQREKEKERLKREKLIEKVRPGLGNKYSKEKMNKLLEDVTKDRNVNKMDVSGDKKSLTSSTAFFSQLQDEVTNSINSKLKRPPAKQNKAHSAKKLKL